jgi:hypothetical protein
MSSGPSHSAAMSQGESPVIESGETRGGHDFVRLLKHASVVAILISVVAHVIGGITAMMIMFNRPVAAAPGREGDGYEFAVMVDRNLRDDLADSSLSQLDPTVPEIAIEDALTDEMLTAPEVSETDGVRGTLNELGPLSGGGDIGGGPGIGDGSGGSGGGGGNFFGVEASGRIFAYIIDMSGSMAYEGKIEALRGAIASSIDELPRDAQFLIVLFNYDAFALGGRTEWTDATDREKQRARSEIMALTPNGGTEPLPAFDVVFAMKPRPHAIYFLTDGEFGDPATVQVTVNSLNKSHKIPIHCITFVNPASEPIMKSIAKESGGSYTHVPGRRP